MTAFSDRLKMRIIYTIAILLAVGISILGTHVSANSDFPVFYQAALKILDTNCTNGSIYSNDNNNTHSLPESTQGNYYIYSVAAAYILAPIALLPYYVAKAGFIFINIICYIFAVIIALRLGGASGRLLLYPIALSFLWMPFYGNLIYCQINNVLLLLVTLSFLAANKNYPRVSGLLLGIAALFKLFPIAFAMILGLKNWRILASCIIIFSLSFLIPDAGYWFLALSNINPNGHSYIYRYFSQFWPLGFWIYACSMGLITAIISYRARPGLWVPVGSIAITATILAMPVVEYHQLTLLIFPIMYLMTISNLRRLLLLPLILIYLTMDSSVVYGHLDMVPYQFTALFGLWIIIATQLDDRVIRYFANP